MLPLGVKKRYLSVPCEMVPQLQLLYLFSEAIFATEIFF